MTPNILKFVEFMVNILSNLKLRYLRIRNYFRKKSQVKVEKTVKKEVDNGEIDKLNDRLMK